MPGINEFNVTEFPRTNKLRHNLSIENNLHQNLLESSEPSLSQSRYFKVSEVKDSNKMKELHGTLIKMTFSEEHEKLLGQPQYAHSGEFFTLREYLIGTIGAFVAEGIILRIMSPENAVVSFVNNILPSKISHTLTTLTTGVIFPVVLSSIFTTVYSGLKYYLCSKENAPQETTTLAQYFKVSDCTKYSIIFLIAQLPYLAASIEKDCGTNYIDTALKFNSNIPQFIVPISGFIGSYIMERSFVKKPIPKILEKELVEIEISYEV